MRTPLTSLLAAAALAPPFPLRADDRPVLTVPVRVHLVHSETMPALHTTLAEADVQRIFEKVNRIWAPAGIRMALESVGETIALEPPEAAALAGEQTRVRAAIPRERLSATALNVCYVKKVAPNGYYDGRLIVVKDIARLREVDGGIDEPLPRVTAHEIGHALGLRHRQDTFNLMASGTTGYALNEAEIETARTTAQKNFPHAARAPRPRLQILNGSAQTVDIFWLETETQRVPNGSIAPGEDSVITTTIGHRFAIVGRDDGKEVTVTSEVPVQGFRVGGVPAFYTQSASAGGYPIVASAKVNPYALKEAAHLLDLMLTKRPDVRTAMIRSGSRLCILAWNEFTTDQPEFVRFKREPHPKFPQLSGEEYWDARARGTGGSQTDPFCTCAEENLLGYPGDPYAAECILIHEFAHCIHLRGLANVDPTFDPRLKAAYDAAMQAGLWKGKYASVNHHEYFAEGVQSWFDNNRENDHDHNHVNTRAELLAYDPGLAALCREVFGDTEIKYTKPATRLTGHLAGYAPATAPTFVWPERLLKAKALIKEQVKAREAAANGGGERETRDLAGWSVRINQALLLSEPTATQHALDLVKAQLDEIVRVVPPAAVAELRKVPIYLSPEYPGVRAKAEYHPAAAWLREHGRDPAMEKAVEITSVLTLDSSVKRMPMLLLHELAHGYHDRVLGHDHAAIKAAYEQAKAGGKYERVERQDAEGRKTMDRHYALTNPQEYFAEASEAWFGRNDFFPYTRDQLAQHDPGVIAVLEQVWNPAAAQ